MVSPAAPFSVQPVADGVYACLPPDGTASAGFIVGDDGAVVIDTLTTPSQARWLLASVRAVTSAPIRYVVNTHWHGDHTFGNEQFRPAGIVAHMTCRDDLRAGWNSTHALLARLYPHLTEEIQQVAMNLADLTFSDALTLWVGESQLELRYFGRAHTRGDIVVLLPKQEVLFAGDLVFNGYVPSMQDSYPSDWLEVLQALEELNIRTVVPGHGPLGPAGLLRDTRDCLAQIIGEAKGGFSAGLSPETTSQSLSMGRFAGWGRQADRLPAGVERVYRELRGELA